MDERDDAARQILFNEMVERVNHGFRGWRREDGTRVDGDGRRDYRRVYGLTWRAHYAKDKRNAMAVASETAFYADMESPPVQDGEIPLREDIEAQALEWARAALEQEAREARGGESGDAPTPATSGETDPATVPAAYTGQRISVRCPKCGASNTPSRTACLVCGAKLA